MAAPLSVASPLPPPPPFQEFIPCPASIPAPQPTRCSPASIFPVSASPSPASRPDSAWRPRGRSPPAVPLSLAPRASSPKRSEEDTSELQLLMRHSSAVFCLKQQKNTQQLSQ